MNKLTISIVVVVLNDYLGLKKTLASIDTQVYRYLEVVVVDGLSIDGTVDVIRDNRDIIDKYISEKDTGIYNAMNKGIDLCTGEWICFLNAGDIFYSDLILSVVVKALNEHLVCVYGGCCFFRNEKEYYAYGGKIYSQNIVTPNHQAMFIRSDFMRSNKYDERFIYWADLDFKIKIKTEKIIKLGIPFVKYDTQGVSMDYIDPRILKNKIRDCKLLYTKGSVNIIGYSELMIKIMLKVIISNITGRENLFKARLFINKFK